MPVTIASHRAEHYARQAIEEDRLRRLEQLFSGTQLTSRLEERTKTAYGFKRNTQLLEKQCSQIGTTAATSGRDAAIAFLLEIMDVTCIDEIAQELGAEFVELIFDVSGAFVPLTGTAFSGGKALYSWGKTAQHAWALYKTKVQKKDVLPGDARAAAEALQQCVRREVTKNALVASRLTAKTAVSAGVDAVNIAGIAGAPAFGGGAVLIGLAQVARPVAGALNMAGAICHDLWLLGRDIKEKRRGNKLLRNPQMLNSDLFSSCPILGCYFLACANTSDIVNFLARDIGTRDWKEKVEKQLEDSIWPLQERAVDAIRNHRYTLSGGNVDRANILRGGSFLNTRRFVDQKKDAILRFVRR